MLHIKKISMIGIDKIKLFSSSFMLKKNHDFTIQTTLKNSEIARPIAQFQNGSFIHASKLFNNECLYANYTINERGLSIEFNPNKHLHNYYSSATNLEHSLKLVRKEAMQLGLLLDQDSTMKVGRIDLCKNAQMDNSFVSYRSVFESMKVKRERKPQNHITTYTRGNRQHQISFYDLTAKMYELHNERISESNLMRCEARFLRSKVIKRIFKDNSLEHILDFSKDQISSIYHEHLKSNVFSLDISKNASFDMQTEIELFRKHNDTRRRNWFINYVARTGIETLIDHFGSIDNIILCMKEADIHKMQLSRYRRKIEELLSSSTIKSSTLIFKELYSELKNKFIHEN